MNGTKYLVIFLTINHLLKLHMILKNREWAKAMRKFMKGRGSNDGLFGFDVKRSKTVSNKPDGFSWFR